MHVVDETEAASGRLRQTALLGLVLILAAALRFYGLDWDGGIGAHPDERYIVGLAEALRWPRKLNPFAITPEYAYGHLPLYLLALVRRLVPGVDALLVGRALAALFDLGTVAMTYALGRRADDGRVGLLAAAFLALTVLHVQQAHFYTADAPLAFFVVATLFFAMRLVQEGRSLDAWLAGCCVGLAVGTKASAGLLAIPLGAASVLAGDRRVGWAWRLGLAAFVAFALTNPFALLDASTFWRNVSKQAAITRGVLDVPYTRQYHGTWPYIYPVVQQLRWGMGWALGLAGFGGWACALWRAVRERPTRAEWVLLSWALPYFAFAGALYAKFPRYLLPLTPLLALYAAGLVRRCTSLCPGFSVPAGFLGLSGLLLLCALLRCLAFVGLYGGWHPWRAASAWIYNQMPSDSVIAVEQWDHPLPLDATDYVVRELPVFDEETPEKWATMAKILSEADYVVIASRRGYATLARWHERYPRTTRYYRQLFGGELAFDPAVCFGRFPRLGPVALWDDPTRGLAFSLPAICRSKAPIAIPLGRLDESFVVYDHPQVIVFERNVE